MQTKLQEQYLKQCNDNRVGILSQQLRNLLLDTYC